MRHIGGMNRILHTLGVLVAAALVACSGSDSPPAATGPLPVDAAVVAQIPAPLAPDAAQARGTFVGAVGPNAAAYVGFVIQGDYALVYLCDGIDGEWFGAQIKDGEIRVVSAAGTVFDATVTADAIEGTVTAPSWSTRTFRAAPPTAGNGIFVGADPTLPDYTRRWLVLPDGVRGVSKIKPTSTLVNVGAVNGVSTGPGALPVKAPAVTAGIVEVVVTPPATGVQTQPLPVLPPVTQAEINASGVPWITFRPGDCYYPRTGPGQTCLSASDWPPQCRSLSATSIACPDPSVATATLPPITQAEIDASGRRWINYGPGDCYGVGAGRREACLTPDQWPSQCRSLTVSRIVCPDSREVTATLPPITQAEINGSGLSWSTFGPEQCFTVNTNVPATCLSASDWPPQCRSLSAVSIVCPNITATLPPVTQAQINASGVPWITYRPGDCYYPRTGRGQTCLNASDWPPQCRSLSATSIACPDPRVATATLPPITQAEINASGGRWINYGPGDCYGTDVGRRDACLTPDQWPPQCRSLTVSRIVCPEPLTGTPTPTVTPPSLAGGKKLDCETLSKLLLSITQTANLKDEAVQKEIAALQAQQKLNGCIK